MYGNYGDQMIPLLYCFLESIAEATYVRMFNAIHSNLAKYEIFLNPTNIQIDYEVAAFNAIKRCFPDSSISGCLFHFAQALWRKVAELGLTSLLNDDLSFCNSVELIAALALVPVSELEECWEYNLQRRIVFTDECNQFF
ncbi:hypothetical protein NGRA_1364 [Nosema granulosis]|uniref:MULE transposase domain-containing protein n=1 Tax=Nosema granulosis TaxID=83296 RepID=A0A9P6H1B1_9MICR|nr:hypothetical protein NGRA_1364 [Nosema granulosis]